MVDDGLTTLDEAAAYLGVAKITLRRWTRNGQLACVRVGKRGDRRFRRQNPDECMRFKSKADENAEPEVKKIHKPGQVEVDPIRGPYASPARGRSLVLEYEPDCELRDTEQMPLLEEGGIEAFIEREVLPHASDAWYVSDRVKTGYEIRFTRHLYKLQPMRSLEAVRVDILALEQESEVVLTEIIGRSEASR